MKSITPDALRSIIVSNIDVTDGKEEYREVGDFKLPPKSRWPVRETRRIAFSKADFGLPLIGSMWFRQRIVDCKFEKCNLDGVNALRTDLTDCAFKHTVLGNQCWSTLRKCRLTSCTFERCNLRSTSFSNCQLSRCQFVDVDMDQTMFRHCTMRECSFDGRLDSVAFVTCDMLDVDLDRLCAEDVVFSDCTFRRCVFPSMKNNFILPLSALKNAEDILRDRLSESGLRLYCELVHTLAGGRSHINVTPKLFDGISGVERGVIMDELYHRRTSGS